MAELVAVVQLARAVKEMRHPVDVFCDHFSDSSQVENEPNIYGDVELAQVAPVFSGIDPLLILAQYTISQCTWALNWFSAGTICY